MDDDRIAHLIGEIDPPGSTDAEDRAVKAALASHLERDSRATSRSSRFRSASLGVLATVLVAASPPGQALADKALELVGIGEPATIEKRASRTFGPVLVAGSGTTPDGQKVELVAFSGGDFERPKDEPSTFTEPIPCFGVDYPETRETGGNEECGEPSGALQSPSATDHQDAFGPQSRFSLEGTFGEGASSVEVTYTDEGGEIRSAPIVLAPPSEEIRAEIGASKPYGYFVAFLPDGGDDDTFDQPGAMLTSTVVRARDQDGNTVKEIQWGQKVVEAKAEESQILAEQAAIREKAARELEEALNFVQLNGPPPGYKTSDVARVLEELIRTDRAPKFPPGFREGRVNQLLRDLRKSGAYNPK